MAKTSLLLALLALALLPAGASAATSHCCGPFNDPGEIVFSPDGRHAYVSDYMTTLALERDPADGTLSLIDQYDGGGWSIAMSSDGKTVYAGGQPPYPSIVVFSRDPASGRLTRVQELTTPGHWPDTVDIVLSPNDRQLYATTTGGGAYDGGGIAIFDRNADGRLTHRRTIPRTDPYWLNWPAGMELSSDGNDLYVADPSLSTVDQFERTADGDLSFLETYSASGLDGPEDSLAMASDGGRLYQGPGQLAAFGRDSAGDLSLISEPAAFEQPTSGGDARPTQLMAVAPETGAVYILQNGYLLEGTPTPTGLDLERTYRDRLDGVKGLGPARAVALSPDGKNLYVTSAKDPWDAPGTVSVFKRDAATDGLTFVQYFKGPVTEPPPEPDVAIIINGGDEYTSDPNVDVTIWPQTSVALLRLSNDGGFAGAGLIPLSPAGHYAWTLAQSGPELLPKTVYAWVDGGWAGARIISDSILLDERPPEIVRLRLRRATLKVRARDAMSGVEAIQIKPRRRAARRWKAYQRGTEYRLRARGGKVRVRDDVGNRSAWRRARRPR